MNVRTIVLVAASAVVALAAWPFLGSGAHARAAAKPTPVPVIADYLNRDNTIAFYEARVRKDPRDQISARMLAGEYMQRYRETGDIGDVTRSEKMARNTIRLQPGNSAAGHLVLASSLTALHRFREARDAVQYAWRDAPDDFNAPPQLASLDMELGDYPAARKALEQSRHVDASHDAVQARYEELTGSLKLARETLERGRVQIDDVIDNPAQARAWYHLRAGEMAFNSGDVETAKQEERQAIATFPNYAMAYTALARVCWATKDWNCALDAATRGANIVPQPETLGYKADAQRALGDAKGAAETQDLIFAIERVGNAYRVSDRLLAIYYSEHGIRLDDALQIARREVAVRGNEIYAQDTLAWAAAMDGRWDEAQRAMAKAIRFDTEDARLQFHAAKIAAHFGRRDEARRRFQRALALNPQFHPVYAQQAREELSKLQS